MSTVTCTNCNAINNEGSKFCSNCGAALPPSALITCPKCKVQNPRNLLYCDNCGTRLHPTGTLSSEWKEEEPNLSTGREAPKAFSLPTRDPGAGDELDQYDLLDWLRTGGEEKEGTSDLVSAEPESETVESELLPEDDWQIDLPEIEGTENRDEAESLEDWLSELENLQEDPNQDSEPGFGDLPDWLNDFSFEDTQPDSLQDDMGEKADQLWDSGFEFGDEETADEDPVIPDSSTSKPKRPSATDFENSLMAPPPFPDDDTRLPDWLLEEDTADQGAEDQRGDAEELPDWLTTLGDNEEDETPTLVGTNPLAADDDESIPDWLNDLPSQNEQPDEPEPESEVEEDDEFLNWMEDFLEEKDSPGTGKLTFPSDEEDEIPDWMENFEVVEDEGSSLMGAGKAGADEDEIPDWMLSFNVEEESSSPTMTFHSEKEGEIPDWLQEGLEEEEPETSRETGNIDDTLVGMSSTILSEKDEESPEEPLTPEADDDIPITVGETEVTGEQGEMADWLDEEEEMAILDSIEILDEEELPDLLENLADDEGTPTLVIKPAESGDNEALPDWLNELSSEESAEDFSEQEKEEDSLPSLLEEAPEVDTGSISGSLIPEDSNQLEGLPEWLDEDLEAIDEDENVLPDWLTELPEEEMPREEGLPAWLTDDSDQDLEDQDVLPSWLSDLSAEDEKAEIDSAVSSEEELVEETVPDWMTEDVDEEMPTVTDSSFEPDESAVDEEEQLDWLSEMSDEELFAEDEQGEGIEEEEPEEDPDWLSQSSEGEMPTLVGSAFQLEETPDEESLPDWMMESSEEEYSLQNEAPGEYEEFEDDDELPDWLKDVEEADSPATTSLAKTAELDSDKVEGSEGLDDDDEEGTDTLIEPVLESEDDEEDLPDWLADFSEEEMPTLIGSTFSTKELAAEDSEIEDPAETTDKETESPDWLADFDDEDDLFSSEESSEPEPEDDFILNWLSEFDDEVDVTEEISEGSADSENIPDWLAGFEDDEATNLELEMFSESNAKEILPEWLEDLEAAELDDDEEELISQAELSIDEALPGSSEISESEEEAAEEEGEEDSGAMDLPDWLAEMPSEPSTIEMEIEDGEETTDLFTDFPSEEAPSFEEELPDWHPEAALGETEEVEAVEPVSEITDEPDIIETAEEEELPEWVADLTSDSDGLGLDDDSDWYEGLAEEEEWPETADEELLSAQLEETDLKTDTTSFPSEELKGVPKEFVSSELPEWLQTDMPKMAPLEHDEEQLHEGEIPDWLRKMKPAELSGSGQQSGLGTDYSMGDSIDEWQDVFDNMPIRDQDIESDELVLSEAEIPAWLQALKPRDPGQGSGQSLLDEEPETDGLMAGVKGALPIAPYMAEPAVSTLREDYTISKEQQQQISLLTHLTREETTKTTQVAQKKSASYSTLVRLVLGIMMIVAVIAGIWLPKTDIELPDIALPVPDSALATYQTVDAVNGRSVLVAFEYTPAMSAELDPIALMLLRQLADNGNSVLSISQTAAGSAIGNRLSAEVGNLDSRALGLLTGEGVGLRSLGDCLSGDDGCEILFGASDSTAIQSELGDVGLVIVLTSDRNSLINWIEQVESQIETPLIAGVSQPLGPLTAPYLSSGQLEGSLNGLPAASAYEKRLLSKEGQAYQLFTFQSILMWVVVVGLIVAGFFYALTGIARRGLKRGSE